MGSTCPPPPFARTRKRDGAAASAAASRAVSSSASAAVNADSGGARSHVAAVGSPLAAALSASAADAPEDVRWPPRLGEKWRLRDARLEQLRQAAIKADRAAGRAAERREHGLQCTTFTAEEDKLYDAARAVVLKNAHDERYNLRAGTLNTLFAASLVRVLRGDSESNVARAYVSGDNIMDFARVLYNTTREETAWSWVTANPLSFGTSCTYLFLSATSNRGTRGSRIMRHDILFQRVHDADVVFVPLNHDRHWTLLAVMPKVVTPNGNVAATWLNSMIGCGGADVPARAAAMVARDVCSEHYLRFFKTSASDPLIQHLATLPLASITPASEFPQQPDVFNCGAFALAAMARLALRQGPLDHHSIDVRFMARIRKRIVLDCLLGYCR